MMKPFGVLVVVFGMILISTAYAAPPSRLCKPRAVSSPCLTVKGRLSLYQGTPSWRVWEFGSHHVFGVLSGDSNEAENHKQIIPERAWALVREDPDKFAVQGTFTLCPFTPRKPGQMQETCMSGAKDLSRVPSRYSGPNAN